MADDDQLKARLARMQKPAAAAPWWRRIAMPAAMLGTGLAVGVYVATVASKEDPAPPPMQTSEVGEFQDDSGLAGFTLTESEPLPSTAPTPVVTRTETKTVSDPQAKADAEAARAALEKARADLAQARSELAAARTDPAVDTAQIDALGEEMQQLRDDMAAKDRAVDELNRDNLRLQGELDLAAQMEGQTQAQADTEAQRLAALERSRAELEAQRASEEAMLETRARSAKVFRFGSTGGGGAASDEQLEPSERFRRAGRTETVRAQVIADPSRTVVQGTLIEATLANAISSQREGNVSATVSYDVWSMDMANVLIPRGSRLFGRYSASVDKGQRRILVVWDRVVTSDGQSAELAAYGTDRVGRSGVTGRVDTHALSRFSAASAVSIIGAAPAVLSAAIEENRDDEISLETVEGVGTNASDTVGSIMKDYIDIPTTISVDQGAVVMVMVDADLEML